MTHNIQQLRDAKSMYFGKPRKGLRRAMRRAMRCPQAHNRVMAAAACLAREGHRWFAR